jgi:hypothetical protein
LADRRALLVLLFSFSLAAIACKSQKRKDIELVCDVRAHVPRGGDEEKFLAAKVKSPEGKKLVSEYYGAIVGPPPGVTDGCKQKELLLHAIGEADVENCALLQEFPGECSGQGEF